MRRIIIDIDNTLWDLAPVLYERLQTASPGFPHHSQWHNWSFWKGLIPAERLYGIVRDVHMDQETFEQMDLNKDDLGDALNYLREEMTVGIIVYGTKPVGVELPAQVEAIIEYTEPAVKGDTSGKVLKAATLDTGYEVQVPLYCNIGDKIRINTATDEFVSRAN